MFRNLKEQFETIFREDPAARSVLEILVCYPGFHAIQSHRLAHRLHTWRIPLLPRLLSQLSRFFTGIEIHPGATIGRRFFIDHGTGVVIGETAVVGDNVMIYHQVTLGALGWWKDMKRAGSKRHPTVEDNVVIGCGASILGPVTIGEHAKIGAMALVIEDVPPHSVVMGPLGTILTPDERRREAPVEEQGVTQA